MAMRELAAKGAEPDSPVLSEPGPAVVPAESGVSAERGGDLMAAIAPSGAADDHEDLAVFHGIAQELELLMARAQARLERGSTHGRRLALLCAKLEDARLHARQGAHEAHYHQ